jgi:hypothetical protein
MFIFASYLVEKNKRTVEIASLATGSLKYCIFTINVSE